MAIIKSKFDKSLSINNQHDYFTLRMPKGTFTHSWRGYKGNGLTNEEFNALLNFVDPNREAVGKDVYAKFQELLNPKVLSKCVKNWNSGDVKLTRGQTVEVDLNKIDSKHTSDEIKTNFAVRGKVSGVVKSSTAKKVTIQITKAGKTSSICIPKAWIK